jgi:hypothetical protein
MAPKQVECESAPRLPFYSLGRVRAKLHWRRNRKTLMHQPNNTTQKSLGAAAAAAAFLNRAIIAVRGACVGKFVFAWAATKGARKSSTIGARSYFEAPAAGAMMSICVECE